MGSIGLPVGICGRSPLPSTTRAKPPRHGPRREARHAVALPAGDGAGLRRGDRIRHGVRIGGVVHPGHRPGGNLEEGMTDADRLRRRPDDATQDAFGPVAGGGMARKGGGRARFGAPGRGASLSR